MKLLKESHADCKAVTINGETPLYMAATLGHREIVELLPPEHPSGAISTPLHAAAQHERVQLFDTPQLLSFLSAADETSNTALHVAAGDVRAGTVRALVERGADVRRRNEDNKTPLHKALSWLDRTLHRAQMMAGRRGHVGSRLRSEAAGGFFGRTQNSALPAALSGVAEKLREFQATVYVLVHAGSSLRDLGVRGRLLCNRIVHNANPHGPRQANRLGLISGSGGASVTPPALTFSAPSGAEADSSSAAAEPDAPKVPRRERRALVLPFFRRALGRRRQ